MIIYKFMFSKGIAHMTNKVTKRTFIDILAEKSYIFSFKKKEQKLPTLKTNLVKHSRERIFIIIF